MRLERMKQAPINLAHTNWLQESAVRGGVRPVRADPGRRAGLPGERRLLSRPHLGRDLRPGPVGAELPRLPRTILSPAGFTDHHLLYHLFLAPWVTLGGMAGAKLAAAAIGAGVFLAAWNLLRQIGVRHASLWTLALCGLSTPSCTACDDPHPGRGPAGAHPGPQRPVRGRPRWLLVLAFAFTWLYDGFVLILAVAGLYALAVGIVERRLAGGRWSGRRSASRWDW